MAPLAYAPDGLAFAAHIRLAPRHNNSGHSLVIRRPRARTTLERVRRSAADQLNSALGRQSEFTITQRYENRS